MKKEYYGTHEVGRFCEVDPKTVRVWYHQGKIKGFYDPGRSRLKFKKEEVISFLASYGYTVPTELL